MPRFEEIGKLTTRHIEAGDFSGAVVRVERRGELLFEGAWGNAMHPGTVFDLASISKLFTATAILRLATLGRLALDQGAADWIAPGSPARACLAGVDIRALMTHSSGLHYWFPFYTRADLDFDSILAAVCEKNPRKPGEVIYSDLNFMLLGRIVERATGLGLREAVRTLVLDPLGLRGACYGPLSREDMEGIQDGVAATEWGNRIERGMVAALGLDFTGWRDESRPILGEADDGNCHYRFGGAAGHAGIFSDARDLCALGTAYLKPACPEPAGIPREPPFLAPELAREALRDHGGNRGLGFQTGPLYPAGGWGHTGFTGTMIHVNPTAGLVFALLANRLHVDRPRDIGAWRRAASEAIIAAACGPIRPSVDAKQ